MTYNSLRDHAVNKHSKTLEECFPNFVEDTSKSDAGSKKDTKKSGDKQDKGRKD